MDWKTDPQLLAEKLIKKLAEGEMSIDMMDARARAHGINGYVLDLALERLHKLPQVKRSVKKGSLYYSLQVAPVRKPITPISHTAWVRDNYPVMTEEDDGSGFDIDLSHLFMSRDEALKYKAGLKGQQYIKKESYEYTGG